jgi:hypothetical protein
MKDKSVTFRITAKGWEFLDREAASRRITVSAVLRGIIVAHVQNEQAKIAEILRSMPIIEPPGLGYANLHGTVEGIH